MMTKSATKSGEVLLDVMHDTTYRYATDVALAHHLAYLRPAETAHQRLESFRVGVSPQPFVERLSRDVFGNVRFYFSLDVPHPKLAVRAVSRVRVQSRFEDFDPASTVPWREVCESLHYRAGGPHVAQAEFAFPSPYIPRHRELGTYASASFPGSKTIAEGALDLMRRIHRDFKYDSDSTEVSTPVLESFRERRGVCQDFAHLMIGALRAGGLAARYVSGYIRTVRPGGAAAIGGDASHAWVSVYCPPLGWVDFDPTNDCLVGEGHVTLAWGRDFGDVSPLRGILFGGSRHKLSVDVRVQPLD